MQLKRLIPYLVLFLAVAVSGAGDSRLGPPLLSVAGALDPGLPGSFAGVVAASLAGNSLAFAGAIPGGQVASALAQPGPARPGLGRAAFPALYRLPPPEAAESAPLVGVLGEAEYLGERGGGLPLLANNQVLAFYGHPRSKRMGILGEYPKEELARLLKGYARLYDEANGPAGVVPAFYLIYGTCWPGGEIGYLKESEVEAYVDYAASQGMLVFLDHQIGKYGVEASLQRLLPFLKYPNVHLALDPEWRTLAPMKEIGSITAEELNRVQEIMSRYIAEEGLGGPRMLVVHQFKAVMIQGRERVKASYPGVHLIHTSDGFGPPALKRTTYNYNAAASNMPLKGFKLFFKTKQPGAGYDEPLLTPPEVLALEPRPALVMYQ